MALIPSHIGCDKKSYSCAVDVVGALLFILFITWRHLHGVEARSEERRRRDTRGEGRQRHAYGSREDGRLERTDTNHWWRLLLLLLHRTDLKTRTGDIMMST